MDSKGPGGGGTRKCSKISIRATIEVADNIFKNNKIAFFVFFEKFRFDFSKNLDILSPSTAGRLQMLDFHKNARK